MLDLHLPNRIINPNSLNQKMDFDKSLEKKDLSQINKDTVLFKSGFDALKKILINLKTLQIKLANL